MSQTGKQDLDEALASPADLQKQLGVLLQRQRVRTWVHAGSSALFFTGLAAVLFLSLENPSSGEKTVGAAIAFGLLGIIQGVLAISSRKQSRAMQTCSEILATKGEEQDQT